MAHAQDELLHLAKEASIGVRKPMGWGGINVALSAIDTRTLTVTVRTQIAAKGGPDRLAVIVRDSLTGLFRDLLPCPEVRVVLANGMRAEPEEERILPFFTERPRAPEPSPVVLIEPVITKWRDRDRARFRRLWKRMAADERRARSRP
jgi:hypothetical protein